MIANSKTNTIDDHGHMREDISLKLLITVDTEPDDQWARGNKPIPISLTNIKSISRFQNLCDNYGVKPTYLITSSIAMSKDAVRILKPIQDEGRGEIGAHLHPWETSPFRRHENTSKYHVFPCELSSDELKEKLQNLTHEVSQSFYRRPTSYRAGRYGICMQQIRVLQNLGYTVDCSVTPFVSWKNQIGFPGGIGGPDFTMAPIKPYFPGPSDISEIQQTGIMIELPLTIFYTGLGHSLCFCFNRLLLRLLNQQKLNRFRRVLHRAILGRRQPKWFRPSSSVTAQELIDIVTQARKINLPYVQMVFHSSELMVGGSPYSCTSEMVDAIYVKLKMLFETVGPQLKSMTLTEFYNSYIAAKILKNDASST